MDRIREFLSSLYHLGGPKRSPTLHALANILRFLNELATQFGRDTVIVRASGMAYNSLLAIVPLVAVFFAVFSGFERFGAYKDQIQQWLFSQIIPTRTDEVLTYVNQFAANSRALGVVSTVFLFITAIMLFDNIEKSFNAIWKVDRKRGLLQRFMTFTNVLLWGPILIALSFYASGRVWAFLAANPYVEIGILLRMIMAVLPLLFSVFAFFLMLAVIPATRVKKRSALLGGAIGAIIWELAKVAFARTAAKSLTYNAIYGSLAVAPIFLVWLYLTWIIVLLAVEISYVHHNFHALVMRRVFARPSARERLHLAVRMFAAIGQAFFAGKAPPTSEDLEDRFAAPSELVEEILDQLTAATVLRATDGGAGGAVGYLPGRSLHAMNAGDVAAAAYLDSRGAETVKGLDRLDSAVSDLMERGEQAATAIYRAESFLELIQRALGDPAAEPSSTLAAARLRS